MSRYRVSISQLQSSSSTALSVARLRRVDRSCLLRTQKPGWEREKAQTLSRSQLFSRHRRHGRVEAVVAEVVVQ